MSATIDEAGNAASVSYTTAKSEAKILDLVLVDGRWLIGKK